MCGISGFFAPERGSVGGWFASATLAAAHRGPDDSGWWSAGDNAARDFGSIGAEVRTPVVLGHLRLSILDLSVRGRQPFLGSDGRALVFNGEIYNYLELRRELESAGVNFVTSTDTEVVLKGFETWGMEAFARLNGMWSIALWDAPSATLLLSRDRMGEKPLFLMNWRDGIAFASEIKQLCGFAGVSLQPNAAHLDRFAITGRPYFGWRDTFFEGVTQPEPGTVLCVSRDRTSVFRYFDVQRLTKAPMLRTLDDVIDATDEALSRSVRLRLRADVPVGVCLSSGVDSTAIARTLSGIGGSEKRFAITFSTDDRKKGEGLVATRTAQRSGLISVVVAGSRDEYASVRESLLWHQETPLPDGSLYAQWLLFQEAKRRGVKVMLDGQGADEVFGGYTKFLATYARTSLRTDRREAIVAIAGLARTLAAAPPDLSVFGRYLHPRKLFGRPGSAAVPENPPLANEVEMRLADLTTWSLPNLLAWEDRNSMAHSVEARLPYLDPELLALGFSISPQMLYRNGWTKFPLRSVVGRRGEPGIAWTRGKRQFHSPEIAWMDQRAQTERVLKSSFLQSGAVGPALNALKETAMSGQASSWTRLRAIDDFLLRFWPE